MYLFTLWEVIGFFPYCNPILTKPCMMDFPITDFGRYHNIYLVTVKPDVSSFKELTEVRAEEKEKHSCTS